MTGALFAFQCYALWYDKIYRKDLDGREKAKAANKQRTTVAMFNRDLAKDIINGGGVQKLYDSAGNLDMAGMDMRRRACQLMCNDLSIHFDDAGRNLEVTLWVFAAADGSRMRIECRGDGSGRGTHKRDEFTESHDKFAFAAIYRAGLSRIDDFSKQEWFPYKSVTHPDQTPPYLSVFAIPLRATSASTATKIRVLGVITVDSAKPYHFVGREKEIADVLMPHIELIKPFVQFGSGAVEIETSELR